MKLEHRSELDEFRDSTIAKAQAGQCEGGCEHHAGDVKAVRVYGESGCDWGYWSYCQTARDEDVNNRQMRLHEVWPDSREDYAT